MVAVLSPEDNSSSPRKKLMVAEGPKASIENNRSSLDHTSNDDHLRDYYKINLRRLNEKFILKVYYITLIMTVL